MADEKVFVQSVRLRFRKKNGKIIESKFTGLAMCGSEEWEEIKTMSLEKAMEGVSNSFIISDPKLIDDIITEDSDQHDIIDTIRSELRSNHHDSLKEN